YGEDGSPQSYARGCASTFRPERRYRKKTYPVEKKWGYVCLMLIRFAHHSNEQCLNVTSGVEVRAAVKGFFCCFCKQFSAVQSFTNTELGYPSRNDAGDRLSHEAIPLMPTYLRPFDASAHYQVIVEFPFIRLE